MACPVQAFTQPSGWASARRRIADSSPMECCEYVILFGNKLENVKAYVVYFFTSVLLMMGGKNSTLDILRLTRSLLLMLYQIILWKNSSIRCKHYYYWLLLRCYVGEMYGELRVIVLDWLCGHSIPNWMGGVTLCFKINLFSYILLLFENDDQRKKNFFNISYGSRVMACWNFRR